MASFNAPQLPNHIADDVPAIRELLTSLAKLDPATGNSDIPAQAKRLVETASGWEIQQYNGTSWITLEKFNLDVQKVDGYSASAGTTANTIPVRDANGKLLGDILGNSATSNSAKTLSAVLGIALGGTGGTTAASARNNLGVPPKSHAASGGDYGKGTASLFGHVCPQDEADATKTAAAGYAASPAALAAVKSAIENAASNTYLPLIGGPMSGAIILSSNTLAQKSTDTGYLHLTGGDGWQKGARLVLYGASHATYPGRAQLAACDANLNLASLSLDPDGKAYIGTDIIITSAGGTMNGKLTGVGYAQKCSALDHTVTPTSNVYGSSITFVDKNGTAVAQMLPIFRPTGEKILRLSALESDGLNGLHIDIVQKGESGESLLIGGSEALTSNGGDVATLNNTNAVGMQRNVNNSSLTFRGGQSANYPGGSIVFYGPNHADCPGEVRIVAKNSSTGTNYNLRVLPDGKATLAGKQVMTLDSTATNSNGWYRKTSDGLIIQGINKPSTTATGTITVTLPTPMSSTDYYVGVAFAGATGGGASVDELGPLARTKNSFTFRHHYADRGTLSFIVIGY